MLVVEVAHDAVTMAVDSSTSSRVPALAAGMSWLMVRLAPDESGSRLPSESKYAAPCASMECSTATRALSNRVANFSPWSRTWSIAHLCWCSHLSHWRNTVMSSLSNGITSPNPIRLKSRWL